MRFTPCSRRRWIGRNAAAAITGLALVSGCGREHRDFQANHGLAGAADIAGTRDLRPGPPEKPLSIQVYDENRWAAGEGQRLYNWFNCAGCHSAGGGGGIGPPFRDDEWIYGSSPEDIYASIVQGRPDGMPAFGDRINAADVWKLVTFVRSMSELTPADTWSARTDNMADINPQRKR